jgi:hypothetical protein
VSTSLFEKVIAPALVVADTSLFAISTPDDENNHFSQLLEKKNEKGEPLFLTLRMGLACNECLEKGKPQDCIHKLAEQPPWKSTTRLRTIQAITGDNAVFVRENQGIIISDKNYVFNARWVMAFLTRPRHTFAYNVRLVHLFIDPGGGGALSDYAMLGITYDNGRTVVLSFI